MTKKIIFGVLIAIAITVTIGLTCSCQSIPAAPDDAINSSKDLQTYVTRSTHNWLSPRLSISEESQATFAAREYRLTPQLSTLIAYFEQSYGDPVVWDMRKLIAKIKTSELYQSDPPDDWKLFDMFIVALESYEHYSEEDQDQD